MLEACEVKAKNARFRCHRLLYSGKKSPWRSCSLRRGVPPKYVGGVDEAQPDVKKSLEILKQLDWYLVDLAAVIICWMAVLNLEVRRSF